MRFIFQELFRGVISGAIIAAGIGIGLAAGGVSAQGAIPGWQNSDAQPVAVIPAR